MTRKQKRRVALVLVVLAIALCFKNPFFELVEVNGSSMWPLLEDGDLLLVSKSTENIERGSVILIRHPSTSKRLLKRLVAAGDQWLAIRHGDICIGNKSDASDMRPIERSREEVEAAAVPVFSLRDVGPRDLIGFDPSRREAAEAARMLVVSGEASIAEGGGSLLLKGGPGSAVRVPGGPLRDDHLVDPDSNGVTRIVKGEHVVQDIHLSIEIARLPNEARLEVDHVLAPAGALTQVIVRGAVSGRTIEVRSGGARVDGPWTDISKRPVLEISSIDDHLLVVVSDGHGDERRIAKLDRSPRGDVGDSHVVVAARGGDVVLSRLDLARDIHYISFQNKDGSRLTNRPDSLVHVPRGCIYLLGDNSALSEDSRQFGVIESHRILGAPRCIVWPPRRMRVLN